MTERLVAVGDVMLGDSATCVGFGFHSRYPRDPRPAFAATASLLARGDVVFGNLECLLTSNGLGSTRYKTDQMRGDPEYAAALRAIGFRAMGVANNHALQHGRAAFDETVAALRAAGIACVGLRGTDGWCAEPATLTTSAGVRMGFLGYSWRPRQYDQTEPPYAEGDVDAVVRDVRRLRGTVDVVVVSLHWGEEFLDTPSTTEVEAAHRIVDAGAAIVVGHHPHVVRPVERHGAGVICYSLGNFVCDMLWQPALRRGTVLECGLTRDGISDIGVTGTRINDSYTPIPESTSSSPRSEAVVGLPPGEYARAVAATVRDQRLAAYTYALRNAGRFPLAVLAELVATTLRNKLAGAATRLARGWSSRTPT